MITGSIQLCNTDGDCASCKAADVVVEVIIIVKAQFLPERNQLPGERGLGTYISDILVLGELIAASLCPSEKACKDTSSTPERGLRLIKTEHREEGGLALQRVQGTNSRLLI